jgi:hypothetical protein
MSDIFISYSKADHALALKLSAFLEAEGWSVWWDKSLGAADLYRDEIMKQLVAARAVISIWTSNSIRSDWVRAEAGRAKADGKLIPVKTSDVAYADIPLPFGEMHTENIASTDLIRAAVVAQLAKPAVEPTAWALLTKGFKYEVLTWIGIVGGVLTLFGNLDAALKLANWAHVLVDHWKEWTHASWVWAFGWLGIHVPVEWTPILSFLLFWSFLTIKPVVQSIRTLKWPATTQWDETPIQIFVTFVVILTVFGWPLYHKGVAGLAIKTLPISVVEWLLPLLNNQESVTALVFLLVGPFFMTDKFHAAVAIGLLVIFWTIITFIPLITMPSYESVKGIAGAIILFLPLIPLLFTPAKEISRRLLFLLIGLILLIALNELSKLAPKLHEWGL